MFRAIIKVFIAAFIFNCKLHAGFFGLTHHSRANCFGFNETVSWWRGNPFYGYVISLHYQNEESWHRIVTPSQFSWRHAAFHTNEGFLASSYIVDGLHFMPNSRGNYILVWHSNTTNCSEYDGWWG